MILKLVKLIVLCISKRSKNKGINPNKFLIKVLNDNISPIVKYAKIEDRNDVQKTEPPHTIAEPVLCNLPTMDTFNAMPIIAPRIAINNKCLSFPIGINT